MPWEATLISIVKAIKIFEKFDITRRIDRVRIDNALQTLRQIFFYPSELIKVLEDIEAGREIDPEVIDFYARDFGIVPNHIREALAFIENDRFEQRNALLIEDIETMNEIRYGKIDARRDISRFFQGYAHEQGRRSNRLSTDAARILGQILRLNTSIKKLETKLLNARNSNVTAPDILWSTSLSESSGEQ